MVGVVQLVERQVVILNVAGSSPVTHPTGQRAFCPSDLFVLGAAATRWLINPHEDQLNPASVIRSASAIWT